MAAMCRKSDPASTLQPVSACSKCCVRPLCYLGCMWLLSMLSSILSTEAGLETLPLPCGSRPRCVPSRTAWRDVADGC